MWVRVRIWLVLLSTAALISVAATWRPRVVQAPLVVAVPRGADLQTRTRLTQEAILLAEARRWGWVDSDPVIGRRLVANLRFLGRTGTDAALVEEAHQLGMDLTDVVVRGRLLDRMFRALDAPAAAPTDTELIQVRAAYGETLRTPERLVLDHVFVSEAHEDSVAATLERLRAGEEAPGDALLDLRAHDDTSLAQLAARYGDAVADLAQHAPDSQWVGPARSRYGLHLVRVTARRPGEVPTVAQARAALTQIWVDAHAPAWRRDRIAALAARWPVTVQEVE